MLLQERELRRRLSGLVTCDRRQVIKYAHGGEHEIVLPVLAGILRKLEHELIPPALQSRSEHLGTAQLGDRIIVGESQPHFEPRPPRSIEVDVRREAIAHPADNIKEGGASALAFGHDWPMLEPTAAKRDRGGIEDSGASE